MEKRLLAGKTVELFISPREGVPLVLLHTVHGEGRQVYEAVGRFTKMAFSFAAIDGLQWDDDMSPWPIPPVAKGEAPCTGGADAYLAELTEMILPEILQKLPGQPAYIALSGYSLAGLFALFAMYRTDLFGRIASVSGSLWYPGFLRFAQNQKMKRVPECIYFSLGDKEARTRNKVLQPVEKNTRLLKDYYEGKGISAVMEMNPGNHFTDDIGRTAKGIRWILSQG